MLKSASETYYLCWRVSKRRARQYLRGVCRPSESFRQIALKLMVCDGCDAFDHKYMET